MSNPRLRLMTADDIVEQSARREEEHVLEALRMHALHEWTRTEAMRHFWLGVACTLSVVGGVLILWFAIR